jgi:hypothetical protein
MQNRLDFIGHSRPGLCTTPLYMLAVALSGWIKYKNRISMSRGVIRNYNSFKDHDW